MLEWLMTVAWAKKIMEHCRGCPHYNVYINGNVETHHCELLIENYDDEDPLELDGSETLLLVVMYHWETGKIMDAEIMDFYPKSCPREQKTDETAK